MITVRVLRGDKEAFTVTCKEEEINSIAKQLDGQVIQKNSSYFIILH